MAIPIQMNNNPHPAAGSFRANLGGLVDFSLSELTAL
jgi:hypothetical protein